MIEDALYVIRYEVRLHKVGYFEDGTIAIREPAGLKGVAPKPCGRRLSEQKTANPASVAAIFALALAIASPAVAAEVDLTMTRAWWDTLRDAVGRERFDGGDVDLWESRGLLHRRFILRGEDGTVARVMRRFCGTVEGSWGTAFWR